MVLFNSFLLIILDFYIYKALRSTRISFAKSATFPWLWWGYSFLIICAVAVSIYVNIPLAVRSIILVSFFLTFTVKFIYVIIIALDDIRRGGVWLARLLSPRKNARRLTNRVGRNGAVRESAVEEQSVLEALEKPLPEAPVKGITRSDFLMKAGILVAAAPLVPLGWGILSGAYDYRIRRQPLYLPNLPAAFDGMTIGQLSDVHSGSFYNKRAVQGGIEMLMNENPDMVFFTGDLVNNLASEMRDYQDIFGKVKAPLGVYSVLGNHDYGHYHFGPEPSAAKAMNLQDLKDTHKVMGWHLLLNENRTVRVDNEEISILGVENWGAGRFPKYGKLDQTLEGTADSPVKLLLSHDPSHWRSQILDHADIDVTFSGHTHGMQFGVRGEHFKWSPVQYIYKEWAGLYTQGQQQLYVNTGFGFLGYPGRVGILPEITIFELKRGTKPIS